jgi:hypothetical protein
MASIKLFDFENPHDLAVARRYLPYADFSAKRFPLFTIVITGETYPSPNIFAIRVDKLEEMSLSSWKENEVDCVDLALSWNKRGRNIKVDNEVEGMILMGALLYIRDKI